jgi:hypothetical protein
MPAIILFLRFALLLVGYDENDDVRVLAVYHMEKTHKKKEKSLTVDQIGLEHLFLLLLRELLLTS